MVATFLVLTFLIYLFLGGDKKIESSISGNLTDTEINGLIHMRQEEKLARDVYDTLSQKWNIRAFGNITQSEQTHMSLIKGLLDKYNIPDPVVDDTVGKYKDQKFVDLYNQLVSEGDKSLKEAIRVGIKIEELDIKDLDEYLAQTKNEDIIVVYEKLKMGSLNHLNAFNRNFEKLGN